MLKPIKYFFISAIIALIAIVYVLSSTLPGLKYSLQIIGKKLPGTITIEKVNGTLINGFKL
ncbi:hypothetical protein N9L02_03795, partial [Gammaproteobacteria bacterium]|nr:hypothetical protein [Gammaproteobacteria bacterium]